MEDVETAQMITAMNQRMAAAEAQTQNLTQVLNNTQVELQHTRAQIPAPSAHSGLLKGVKTRAPDRLSGRPTASYPTTNHLFDVATRYMRVGGVPPEAQVDYIIFHLLEGEARTWYDLRAKSIVAENFVTFATALRTHFTNHNSQRHYREAI